MELELGGMTTENVPVSTVCSIPAQARRKHEDGRNVGDGERVLSAAGGSLLVAYGLRRRGLPGIALAAAGGALALRGATGKCPAYRALGVSTAASGAALVAAPPALESPLGRRAVRVERTITIARPLAEVDAFLRDHEALARMIPEVGEIERAGGGRTHWSVHFAEAPGGRGTEVRAVLDHVPPGGKLGRVVEKALHRDPDQHLRAALRRVKQWLEAGEIPTVDGQPAGKR